MIMIYDNSHIMFQQNPGQSVNQNMLMLWLLVLLLIIWETMKKFASKI